MKNIDSLEEAMDYAKNLTRFGDAPPYMAREAASGFAYLVTPFVRREKDLRVTAAGTLWVHCSVSWSWDFFSYASDSWAWVTDAQDGGSPVAIDRICAYLRHDSCYGNQEDCQTGSAAAHALLRNGGIGVCKASVCGNGCADQSGYGHWCTPDVCA